MTQAITTQNQASITQSQAMKAQDNWEVVPWAHQKFASQASHLWEFTKINPPTFYRSKFEKELQDFIDEIFKILYAMRMSTSKRLN